MEVLLSLPSCFRFLDFVLPADAAERELVLSRDRGFAHISSRSSSVCCCCRCCVEGTEPWCSCSKGDACVAQLLQREVDAHRALEVRRRILGASPEFKLLAAFQFVEDPHIAAVTPVSLAETLEGEGFALTQPELQLIFRRLDRSCCCGGRHYWCCFRC